MNLPRLFVGSLALASLLARPAAAQVLDPAFTPPASLYAPGAVYALGPQQTDGKRVVAGLFTRINGTAATALIRLDATGALDQPFSQNVGAASNIYRVRALPSGQYLLGAYGGNVVAGGLSRAELMRLNANGTADASFNAGTGPVVDGQVGDSRDFAAQPDGKVVVVGDFDTFNNVPAGSVVRLNANGSVDTSFSTGTGVDLAAAEAVTVAVQADSKVLLGGNFNAFNGQPAYGVVRLNANGSIDPTFTSPFQTNASVVGLVLQPDGKILVHGNFVVNSTPVQLARLNANGSVDLTFTSSSIVNYISTRGFDPGLVLQPDGKMLLAGSFNTTNPFHSSTLARLNADGTLDSTFPTGNGPSSNPFTVGLQANGSVLVGGAFNLFNGRELPLGRLTSSGLPDPAFTPIIQSLGIVTAVARQADGQLVIGGNFTEINGQAVHRLARLTYMGALDAAYSTATGLLVGQVAAIVLQPDGKALVGTSTDLYRFQASGSPDASFTPAYHTSTYALAIQPDGRIIWGSGVSTSTFIYLMRLTSSGAYDPTFARPLTSAGLGTPGLVNAIVVQPDGRIVVGGGFFPAGQAPVSRVVRYESNGAFDPTFNYSPVFRTGSAYGSIYGLALQPDGKLLANGAFNTVDGVSHSGVVRLAATGGLDASFAPLNSFSNSVYALARQPNGRVLLGGNFSNTASTGTLNNLARVLDDGQPDASFGPTTAPNGTVRSLLVQPDGAIILAGSFTTVGGQASVGVARIIAANVLHVAAPAAVAARTTAWPVPAHGLLHIAPDQSAQPLTVELLDALGRPVRTQPATSAPEQTLSLESLPAGMYLLRVSYAVGTVTRRIAVQ